MANIVERVMIPSPPTWKRMRITILPNGEKYVAVSFTISPVTHVALVAVNRVSTGCIATPAAVARGELRRIKPMVIVARKLNIIN
jgi:hypothetical protein